jgi:predicted  nucleic acid-binding Zn-ribbon protein
MSKMIREQIGKTEILISGLRNNLNVVEKWGINEQLIKELETEKTELNVKNQEIERLLDEARNISKEANDKLSILKEKFLETKKKVKINTDSARWEQFGVLDKR